MSELKVGVIGLGVGRHHVAAFNEHPLCRVTHVCDLDAAKLDSALRTDPTCEGALDPQAIINNPQIDIVSVASYDEYHAEQVIRALKNGKHVFVEKPMCMSQTELDAIQSALDDRPRLRLSSNLNLRTCPRFGSLRDAIQSGELGSVFYLEADYLWGRVTKLTHGWRSKAPFYSIVHGAAVHMFDLVMWLTGDRPAQVQGYGNNIATSRSGFRFNDFAAVFLRFANGMIAKVVASGGCVHPHFHRVSVFGTERTFSHELTGARVVTSSDPNAATERVDEEYPAIDQKASVITSFIDSILDDTTASVVPTEDVFATMSVCFAAEQAIAQGKPVQVEYL